MNRKTPPTLDHAIHRMVHHGHYDVTELADILGWSESSLYRSSNPHDDGANFPAKKLTGSMMAQRDFGPLMHMNQRCGFIAYPVPKKVGKMKQEDIANLQRIQAEAGHAIIQFFQGELTRHEAMQKIDAAITELARARKAVDHGIKQEELEL